MNTLPVSHANTSVASFLNRGREFGSRLATAFESPWVAYGLIVALQLKLLWGLWAVADVVAGDLGYYYANAWRWHTTGHGNYAWSPLYTAFYSLFFSIDPDPNWANVAHRITIVMSIAVLALAVFRQLLPAAVAWLCAAWLVVNPIVYDAMYEVHLFALIPTLLSILLLSTARTPWRRGAGLGVLGITTVLCRNELSVAFGILGLGLAVLEWRRIRRHEGAGLGRTLVAYAVALSVAALACGFVYSRSSIRGEELAAEMQFKHTLPMRQMYATAYAARHPEWKLRGMTQGDALMTDTFGKPDPTLVEMMKANPKAVAEHWSWNTTLFPNGVELLLFNRASGAVHPDFFPPSDLRLNHWWPAVLLGGLCVLWIAGLTTICRRWSQWKQWIAPRAPAWFLLFGLACVAVPVTLTCRPRPAYMFGFGVTLIVLTGLCVWVLATRLRAGNFLPSPLVGEGGESSSRVGGIASTSQQVSPPPVGEAPPTSPPRGLLATLPTYANGRSADSRPIAETLARLEPHRAELAQPGITLVGSSSGISLYVTPTARIRRYLTDSISGTTPNVVQYTALELGWQQGEPMHAMLTRIGADYLYLDERVIALLQRDRPAEAKEILAGQHAPGWQMIDADDSPGRRWRFYKAIRP
ncbi:MAG: hypothetical protein K8U57_23840 [Planctomycetes bacterium]|nr:hypothetical protein [Planctomycetota bacterium]